MLRPEDVEKILTTQDLSGHILEIQKKVNMSFFMKTKPE
jgi:hypothetical protein